MLLRLVRSFLSPEYTLGSLEVDGDFECWVLEDTVRIGPKVPGKTAIPYGHYAVDITYSNRFHKDLPLLLNVPNFSGVRIHSGNKTADTEGCLLVGFDRYGDGTIGRSRDAFNNLFPKLVAAKAVGQDISIDIVKPQAPGGA